MQALARGDQKKKRAKDNTAKIIRCMTEFTIKLGGRQCNRPNENKIKQTLQEWYKIMVRKYEYWKKAETEFLEVNMKRVCDALLNNFGKLSNGQGHEVEEIKS